MEGLPHTEESLAALTMLAVIDERLVTTNVFGIFLWWKYFGPHTDGTPRAFYCADCKKHHSNFDGSSTTCAQMKQRKRDEQKRKKAAPKEGSGQGNVGNKRKK